MCGVSSFCQPSSYQTAYSTLDHTTLVSICTHESLSNLSCAAPACHPALILTVILLSSITQPSSSQYVSILPAPPSLTVSFLQSLYSIQRCLSLCIQYLIMVVVKDIGIHYYSAYSLCGGTNPKLYTHRLRLNIKTTID